MRFRKIYLEITNVCNLRCSFCPGTRRKAHFMTEEEFVSLLPKLRPYTDFLYFHLMGEPLCHPKLAQFLHLAGEEGFRVILTTNGILLSQKQEILLKSPALHKVNISLHAFEANEPGMSFCEYLQGAFMFGQAVQSECIVSYRLWNRGGAEQMNRQIIDVMRTYFPEQWVQSRQGHRIAERVYLEFGEKFDWPDQQICEGDQKVFCYGLRDQIGVLCDGSVVPCCLDHEGNLTLGNLFKQDMEEILQSTRARDIYDGFSGRIAVEELCRKCGYARRFCVD